MSPRALDRDPPKQQFQPRDLERLLRLEAPRFGLNPSQELPWERLGIYLAELSRWRRSMNLTGKLSAIELVSHTLESVIGECLIVHGARVIDIGSGAGFPGMPLAIARDDVRVSFCEPRERRAAFLRHVIRTLSIHGTEVIESRAEEVGGQTFDVATMRAVKAASGWSLPPGLLGHQGLFLAWTTEAGSKAIATWLGPSYRFETSVSIPDSKWRCIAAFRSTRSTRSNRAR